MNSTLARLNPRVSRPWRLALAGIMWTGVGALLCVYAIGWLAAPAVWMPLAFAALGVAIAFAGYHLQFSKLALKNIARIQRSPDRACVFSFLAWHGYLIIAFMMTLGIVLKSSPFPKPDLAVIYLAVGGALILASAHYYRQLALAAPQ